MPGLIVFSKIVLVGAHV